MQEFHAGNLYDGVYCEAAILKNWDCPRLPIEM